MGRTDQASGSGTRWGPLFGAHAEDWAETWEGAAGWGTPAYEHVLAHGPVEAGTRVLDCGCGAGRFLRMAADIGAEVAGIDASAELVDITATRTPDADVRVGDLEALPWDDDSFDVVTGFSSFQFADDKVKALREAGRVSRDLVVAVIPTRAPESDLAAAFTPIFPLFPSDALAGMKSSGIFALTEPGRLDEVLTAAGLTVREDVELACPATFPDTATAVRAFLGAGPMQLALEHSGQQAVTDAIRDALAPFTGSDGRVTLDGWYRLAFASSGN